jgi:hypothetical protein
MVPSGVIVFSERADGRGTSTGGAHGARAWAPPLIRARYPPQDAVEPVPLTRSAWPPVSLASPTQ